MSKTKTTPFSFLKHSLQRKEKVPRFPSLNLESKFHTTVLKVTNWMLSTETSHGQKLLTRKLAPLPEGYKEIPCHLVFDAKFDGRRKARLIAGGHRAPDTTEEEACSGAVSMETI